LGGRKRPGKEECEGVRAKVAGLGQEGDGLWGREGEMGLREREPKGGLGVDFYFKTSFPLKKTVLQIFLYTKIVREKYVFI
jgi:hypothetical protein